jgi:hypothetical protein
MSTSLAISAFGTLWRIGDGLSPETFATLGELKTLSGPKISVDALETTTHNSPSRVRRYVPGLAQIGDISGTINFSAQDPTHGINGGILYLILTGACRNHQMVLPDSANTIFGVAGFYTSFDIQADPAGLLTASWTFRVAGGLVVS